jgi:hypothetical protein
LVGGSEKFETLKVMLENKDFVVVRPMKAHGGE